MFRRNTRNNTRSASSTSRQLRRLFGKASRRGNASDRRWLNRQAKQQLRFSRFRTAIRKSFSFVSMIQSKLTNIWAAMVGFMSQMMVARPTRPIRTLNRGLNRSGMIRLGGGKKSRNRRSGRAASKKSLAASNNYELLEARQLLAVDILGCLLYTSPSPRD